MFAALLRRSGFEFFYLDFYQGPSKLNWVWNMQFFFVQVKAARGILKLIHELIMQTELQNPSGEAQARKFTCEQDAVKQLSIINVPVIVNLN